MLLQVDHISHSFGTRRVLSDVSFSLDGGQLLALLGHNGAGKTTLLRAVTRLVRPDAGCVLFDGHPMTDADLRRVGYLPEERGLYRRMRAGDQVVYLARLRGLARADAEGRARRWFERLGMADWWRRPVAELSKGMQQRVQLAAAVVHDPALLILDEPFSGLDDEGAALLVSQLSALKADGTAVILSTHNRAAALGLCDQQFEL